MVIKSLGESELLKKVDIMLSLAPRIVKSHYRAVPVAKMLETEHGFFTEKFR